MMPFILQAVKTGRRKQLGQSRSRRGDSSYSEAAASKPRPPSRSLGFLCSSTRRWELDETLPSSVRVLVLAGCNSNSMWKLCLFQWRCCYLQRATNPNVRPAHVSRQISELCPADCPLEFVERRGTRG